MTETTIASADAKPPRKNIVICCDGTGNDFSAPNPSKDPNDGQNSNVIKLYTALVIDNRQVGYYHPGVGTMGAPNAGGWLSQQWSKTKGLAFGAGFRDNLLDAYRYLMEQYNDNGGNGNQDEVYIFGFSRGAYTARALAGLLHGYGLLCRGNEGHLAYAWQMYVQQHNNRDLRHVEPDDAFRETFSHKDFKIHFVGVWDTVSSVGWIATPLRLFNVAQNDTIETVRHAVSIDEHRAFFQDNLLGDPTPGQDLVQAWFAGVHSDIGGSYLQPESGLPDYTLKWMLAEAESAGLQLDPVRKGLIFGQMPDPPVPTDILYDPPTSWKLHHSLTWKWWVQEIVPHIYYNKDDGKEYRRVPLGLRLRQLPAGSLVHRSVMDRMLAPPPGAAPYAPRNVRQDELTDAGMTARDGTQYLRFTPIARGKTNPVLQWLDRFVVTWFFALFDVLVFLPVLVGALLTVAAVIALLLAKVCALVWTHMPGAGRWLWHSLIAWFAMLVIFFGRIVLWTKRILWP
jgi:uncharacterized protein (DUF2235 family)